jgi:tetratricopeptide (TPR) repeat protein
VPGSSQWVGVTYEALQKELKKNPGDIEVQRSLALLHWLHRDDTQEARSMLTRLANEKGDRTAHYALMIMAAARDHTDEFWTHATALVASAARPAGSAQKGRWRDPMAQQAVVMMSSRIEERHNGAAQVEALIASTQAQELPIEVRETLVSILARQERAQGKDYRASYAASGCVQSFALSEVEGSFGALDLFHHDPKKAAVMSDDSVVPLSCSVRVWNPEPEPGFRRLFSEFEVPKSRHVVAQIAADAPLRIFVDGMPVGDDALRFRYVARQRRFELELDPGLHRLEIALAVPNERSWILLRLVDENGQPLKTRKPNAISRQSPGNAAKFVARESDAGSTSTCNDLRTAARPGIADPLVEVCEIERAIHDVDVERGQPAAARLGRYSAFAEGQWMAARWWINDISLDPDTQQSRSYALLEPLIKKHPEVEAALALELATRWSRGEKVEVVRMIEGLAKHQLASLSGWLFRHKVFVANGNEVLAQNALAQAEKIFPTSCDVLERRWSEARGRGQVLLEREWSDKMLHCPNSAERAALNFAARHEHEQAIAAWKRVLERTPDDLEAWAGIAFAHRAKGRFDEAVVALRQALKFAPFRGSMVTMLADILAVSERKDEAASVVANALALRPSDSATRALAARFGQPDPLLEERADGEAAIKEYLQRGDLYQGEGAVMVLDRDVLWINDDGSARHLVHQISELKSKEAIDRFGEVEVPDGARLLTLRTRKRDGTSVDPEIIADKDAISMRELELGDFVEMEFIAPVSRGGPQRGALDGGAFRFQSVQEPFYRSDYSVVYPSKMLVEFESRNGAPEPTQSEREGRIFRQYVAHEVPRFELEPFHRAELDVLPAVTVHAQLHAAAQANVYAASLIHSLIASPELRAKVQSLIRGAANPQQKVEAIWVYCRDEVEHEAGFEVSANETFLRKRGNRHVLFATMLREAGIDAEIWFARSVFDTSVKPGGYPHWGAYDAPYVAVRVPGASRPELYFASQKWVAKGYLFPAVIGSTALRIGMNVFNDEDAVVHVPSVSSQPDLRRYALDVSVDERGTGHLRGKLELSGIEAAQWRSGIEELDPAKLNQAFQSAEFGQWPQGGGLELLDLKIDHADQPDLPLLVTFGARVRELGVFQGGGLNIPVGFVAMNAAERLASLPERQQALVISEDSNVELDLTLTLSDSVFAQIPGDLAIKLGDFGRYERQVIGKKGDSTLKIKVKSSLMHHLVPSAEYADLGEFAQDVRAAELEWMRVR